ncbi:BTAD domain-containing putative transcriptional regulator [Mycobacterium sp. ITM-2016-00318]|nr:BTAD domain-containing putative transcriptional regulator [Mycobacterium sp. ITM-2016-00318]WNG95531.1 BTAD domain-containing putative transcriptional regulator [Mycobacterium sp. ITM-2016-00318]
MPGAKPRAILSMLGLHGGSVVSAEALVELLWGDDPPRTAAKAMQTHISALRRALGDGFVLTEGTGWTLSTAEIDATRYKSAAQHGRDAIATGDARQAVTHFDEALALWRGIPELPDGRRGVSEKTRWIEGHAALVDDRADALLATGRAAEIIGELEAAIADSPLRERRWGHLMLALYRAGRQGEALGAYQRARSLLAEELGVDPGPDLRRLESAIVAHDVSLELPVSHEFSAVTRAVTFLLTDIEGSTAAWEADPDAMAAALARHDEIVEQVVTFRGGRLIKTRGEGDATFSVFDRPSAAAAAAIELQEAIRREPWPLADPMRIRVALHTGEVEFRDGDYFGRAVNRVARLRSLAVGGQILCSGATAELVIDTLADDVALTDLGMRQLKNLPRPEHVFELRIEAQESRTPTIDSPVERPSLPTVLADSGPFFGRGRELERLLATWQTTQVAGSHAVLISGEPGVGKTRLAGEWSRQAYEQGAIVLYGRCDEDLGAPYQPFSEALRSLVPGFGTSRLRGIRGIEALIPLVPELTEVLPELAAPPRADPGTERYALFDAVGALLGTAASSAPVILVLDDLHWAAKPTLLLLRHLLRFGEHTRIQIVGTYRSTDLDRSHPLAAMLADLHRDGSVSRLTLGGLDENDVTAYVADAGYDDEELARALASVTGGNPFFLIEALRHVDESDGRWDPTTLPQGVREAVSRRLSRLSAETNTALATAAVVGSRFELALVERVVGHDLVDAFDESAKAGIVIEEPGGRYRFNHAIVRQSLLAELASVRRMRLHHRIATTLESESAGDDELLAELAYHYFECAWAGNAAKAVDYCRRAADQAMARLAYEGAADLYNKAVHALEDLDAELPDRDDQRAELLVARCEALLAAGDVVAAEGAVSQLLAAAHFGRLAAWGACFDGQLSMLTDPERLDEIESAVADAAASLAQFEDAAGEAKAHTVRAGVLARLGRIGDAETALDQALTAARRARDHRRVNAVLAGAPLAALWGPNPVPRAGGRCLDVVRLLRITTGSPVVEATSTRCQGVLDAFRGRASAGRQLIESARRSLTELGMRHALLEVDQFAGIVESVADDPAAAEPLLRRAYNGFRRMGLEADTAETAALLARVCLALDRDTEADELCTESERLAGHALKAAISWRTVRAQLLARGGAHDDARRIAEEAVAIAERTDLLVDHGDACLALAIVSGAAADSEGQRVAAEKAVALYESKGAVALAAKARSLVGGSAASTPAEPESPALEVSPNLRAAIGQMTAAINREAWDEVERLLAPQILLESRRKIVGFPPKHFSPTQWSLEMRRYFEVGIDLVRGGLVAVRGERLALGRLEMCTVDPSSGAPKDEVLELLGIDQSGRVALQLLFDIEDIDAATAELDAQYALEEQEPPAAIIEAENSCVRAVRHMESAWRNEDWEAGKLVAPRVHVENRRKIVGVTRGELSSDEWITAARQFREPGMVQHRSSVAAVRAERLALTRVQVSTVDKTAGAPQDEMLILYGIDDRGRIALQVTFDADDFDAAIAELDAQHQRLEEQPPRAPLESLELENAASRVLDRFQASFAAQNWSGMTDMLTVDHYSDDRRPIIGAGIRRGRESQIEDLQGMSAESWTLTPDVIAIRGERLLLYRGRVSGHDQRADALHWELLVIVEIDAEERIAAWLVFEPDDSEAAFAELDARYLAGEAAPHARTWSAIVNASQMFNRREMFQTTANWINVDHRRVTAFESGEQAAYVRATWGIAPDVNHRIVAVHRLSDFGTVFTQAESVTSGEQFEAEWREIVLLSVDGEALSRCEIFDETDLRAAITKFDELEARVLALQNSATRARIRMADAFNRRDLDSFVNLIASDGGYEDLHKGSRDQASVLREVARRVFEAPTSWRQEIEAIATRGSRVGLMRERFRDVEKVDRPITAESLTLIEVGGDDLVRCAVIFDPDDIDAAFAELDARYLAGEAAEYAQTWSTIARSTAMFNQRQIPAGTDDFVSIDHRKGTAFVPGELTGYLRATYDLTPQASMYIEAVHRVSKIGAVFVNTARGISHDGFAAEWRVLNLVTVSGDLLSRYEVFDEADLDAALASFDELTPSAPQLENAATRLLTPIIDAYNRRDLDAYLAVFGADARFDDRRKVLRSSGPVYSSFARELLSVPPASWRVEFQPIAIRGNLLALSRCNFFDADEADRTTVLEVLAITEVDDDELVSGLWLFDPEDMDTAIAELDARYAAGEAAAYAHTWSLVTETYAGFNRRELLATAPDWSSVDHRRGITSAQLDVIGYAHAAWDVTPDVRASIEKVHRLSDVGAVVTAPSYGTSRDGFPAARREIHLLTFEGNLGKQFDFFDEDDLDAALAQFDELNRQAPPLENAATRLDQSVMAAFNRRDLKGYLGAVDAEARYDDRRRGLRNEGPIDAAFVGGVLSDAPQSWRLAFEPIAIRGHHLALSRHIYRDASEADRPIVVQALVLTEVRDQLVNGIVVFDTDDVDAAFAELDARYLAGEAAPHAQTWSSITRSVAGFNNHELPSTALEWIDRRRLVGSGTTSNLTETTQAAWDITLDIRTRVQAVHRLNDGGAVITQSTCGTSQEGFDFELRVVDVFTLVGGTMNRCEMFDEADIDAALTRFDELNRSDEG